jgi:hypothetical protein
MIVRAQRSSLGPYLFPLPSVRSSSIWFQQGQGLSQQLNYVPSLPLSFSTEKNAPQAARGLEGQEEIIDPGPTLTRRLTSDFLGK